jgi:hypothetical protein
MNRANFRRGLRRIYFVYAICVGIYFFVPFSWHSPIRQTWREWRPPQEYSWNESSAAPSQPSAISQSEIDSALAKDARQQGPVGIRWKLHWKLYNLERSVFPVYFLREHGGVLLLLLIAPVVLARIVVWVAKGFRAS